MFRSPRPERLPARGASRLLVAACLAAACSSTFEWEEKVGSLKLYASPVSPIAGEPVVLAVEGKNVGPVRVFQGDRLIAAFANEPLEGDAVQVTALSSETPRATAVAYDYRRLEVDAVPFANDPPPSMPDAGVDSASEVVEECPGVEDASGRCSTPSSSPIAITLHNAGESPLSVYERPASPIDPTQCTLSLVALLAPGATQQLSSSAGAVLRVVDDRTAGVVRDVLLPERDTCTLVLGN